MANFKLERKAIVVFSILTLFLASISHAGIGISGVSGVFDDGNQVTVTGGSFGIHPDFNSHKPYLNSAWGNLESGKLDQDVFTGSYGAELVVGGNNQRRGSQFCARGYRWTTSHQFTNVWGEEIKSTYMYGISHQTTGQKVVFMSAWYMFPQDFEKNIAADGGQTKFMMLDPKPGAKTYFTARNQLQTNTEDGDLQESHGYITDFSPYGQWHRFDIYVDLNNRIHDWYVDGRLLPRKNPLYSKVPPPFTNLTFLGYQFEGNDLNTWMQYADDFYISFTQARIEISASSKWDNTVQLHKELQVPLKWSNSTITFTANRGSFQNGEHAYLYVVDANGNVNAQGYPITIGGSGGGAPQVDAPEPPTGLRIIE